MAFGGGRAVVRCGGACRPHMRASVACNCPAVWCANCLRWRVSACGGGGTWPDESHDAVARAAAFMTTCGQPGSPSQVRRGRFSCACGSALFLEEQLHKVPWRKENGFSVRKTGVSVPFRSVPAPTFVAPIPGPFSRPEMGGLRTGCHQLGAHFPGPKMSPFSAHSPLIYLFQLKATASGRWLGRPHVGRGAGSSTSTWTRPACHCKKTH